MSRAEFEKWGNAKGTMGNSWDGECYQNDLHQAAWQAWQAATERCARTIETRAKALFEKAGKENINSYMIALKMSAEELNELARAIRSGEGQ